MGAATFAEKRSVNFKRPPALKLGKSFGRSSIVSFDCSGGTVGATVVVVVVEEVVIEVATAAEVNMC